MLKIQNNIYKDIIYKLIDKLFAVDLEFYETHSSGDLQQRFGSVGEIYDFISNFIISTIIEIITAFFCGIVMARQSMILFMAVLVIVLIQYIYKVD